VTQASLSPDLDGALGASPSPSGTGLRGSTGSEASLWIIALTSSGLLIAAVLLVGLLAQSSGTDASLAGFVTGIAMIMATAGIGALGYVLVIAKRQGLLAATGEPRSVSTHIAPSGMQVVSALPADATRRKRLEREAEHAARSRQAKAIAVAAASSAPRAPAPRPIAQRPANPRPVVPVPVARRPVAPTSVAQAARPAPRPAPARVAPAPANRMAPPASVRPRPVAYAVHPAIRMPRPPARPASQPAWPAGAPAVRVPAPYVAPRTQVALYQINAANVRTQAITYPR
jgi:hypothetical protein